MKIKAFTLLEVLITLTIISILMSVGIAVYSKLRESVLKKATQIELKQYKVALYNYYLDNDVLPESIEELENKGYITHELAVDSWNVYYRLEKSQDEGKIKIISCGPDKKYGTQDDISSEEVIF